MLCLLILARFVSQTLVSSSLLHHLFGGSMFVQECPTLAYSRLHFHAEEKDSGAPLRYLVSMAEPQQTGAVAILAIDG